MSHKCLLFVFLFISLSIQTCGDGCNKCGLDNVCLTCNFQQGYFNDQGTCKKNVNTKCITQGANGKCNVCNIGYKLDTATSLCVQVATPIDNCLYYNESGSCKYCRPGFYPSSNLCIAVPKTISNCQFYLDASKCLVCEPWYTLSSDYKSCTSDSDISNCYQQTNFHCEQCSDGYILNPNNYIYSVFNTADSQLYYSFFNSVYSSIETNSIPEPCQKIELNNCNKPANAF